MKYLVLITLLCGCSYESIGLVSLKSHNSHVSEAQTNYTDAVKNQAKIGGILQSLNFENEAAAMAADDMVKLKRVLKASAEISVIIAKSEELTERKFEKAPEASLNFGFLAKMAAMYGGPLGIAAAGAYKLYTQSQDKKELKGLVSKCAESTEVDDVSNHKALS